MRRAVVFALLVLVMLAALAPAAFATVHPQSRSECSADAANGTPANSQNPPGITDDGAGLDTDNGLHKKPVEVANENSHKEPGCPAPA